MKPWEDLTEPLEFPIRGKVYRLPELPYQSFLTIQALQAGKPTELDDADPDVGMRLVTGAMWDEMAADNVPAEAMSRAGISALAFVLLGRDMAEQVWEAGIDPKALAESIQRRLASQPAPTSTSTASETETPSPVSSTPTTSLRTSSKKRAKAGGGSRSSNSAKTTGR